MGTKINKFVMCLHKGCGRKSRRNGVCDTHSKQIDAVGYTWDIGTVRPIRCNWSDCEGVSTYGRKQRCIEHHGKCNVRDDSGNFCMRSTVRNASITGSVCPMHYERMRAHGTYGGLDKTRAESFRITRNADGDHLRVDGYVLVNVLCEDGKQRQKMKHRVLMEGHLGRPLLPKETVHHINGDRQDNRIENLELWSSRHPKGQRVEDKVAWAIELLKQYAPETLR